MNANANNLELNEGDDFVIGLDISMSMGATDCPGGISRILYCIEMLKTFGIEAAKYDTDGVSLYAFGQHVYAYPDLTPEAFATTLAPYATGEKLEPMTMTHLAIQKAWAEHVERENKQTFLILFTDGSPTDKKAVKDAIIQITNDVKDANEFKIGFVTVGQRPADLEAFLTELDDDLKGAKYDIVDVRKLEETNFIASVAGALVD